jgi:hypothetical protein
LQGAEIHRLREGFNADPEISANRFHGAGLKACREPKSICPRPKLRARRIDDKPLFDITPAISCLTILQHGRGAYVNRAKSLPAKSKPDKPKPDMSKPDKSKPANPSRALTAQLLPDRLGGGARSVRGFG